MSTKRTIVTKDVTMAILSDVHLHDVYASLEGLDADHLPLDQAQRRAFIRPMADQLRSTRMFNENYFALRAALDNMVARGVRYVIIPGDFSDDGQRYNTLAFRRILNEYRARYGLQYFATLGNHDPVRPQGCSDVSLSFLDHKGEAQAIYSQAQAYQVYVSAEVAWCGYEELVSDLADFGFYPQSSYCHWETPYSSYTYEEYDFEQALAESDLALRHYSVQGSSTMTLPDASYLVEPIEGIWILAIDANAFSPDAVDKHQFGGSGNGYNTTFRYKQSLLRWVQEVAARAHDLGKQLIAFSHYPLLEYYHGAGEEIASLLGPKAMQLNRKPKQMIGDFFANTGIRLHFGGHMHVNQVGFCQAPDSGQLVNVQVPSLAGYSPAYILLTLKGSQAKVETIPIIDVPGFNTLFPIYEQEHAVLVEQGQDEVWDKDILGVSNYKELLLFHLKEVVRLYFLQEWSEEYQNKLLSLNGLQMLQLAGLNLPKDPQAYASYESLTGFELIYDFYRLFYGGSLALSDLGPRRLRQYRRLYRAFDLQEKLCPQASTLLSVLSIVNCFMRAMPTQCFTVDLCSGEFNIPVWKQSTFIQTELVTY